jgi:hypothetical protein
LNQLAGEDFLALDPTQRVEVVCRLETEAPEFFGRLLTLTYFSYYAQPPVVATIRAMGFDYNDAPQPRGYTMEPFDPTNPEMLPVQPHGWYKATHVIRHGREE